MNSKASKVRVTYQDLAEIIQRTNSAAASNSGDVRGTQPSLWGTLFSGRAEHRQLRPGLKLLVTNFCLDQEIEIVGGFSQTELAFVLTIDGSWSGSITDHRGRTSELHVNPGLNVGTVGPPQKYSVSMKGGQFHRGVRVEITDPFLAEMFAGTKMEVAHLAQLISKPCESRRVLINRNLSPALECLAYQVVNCSMHAAAGRLFLEGKVLEILAHQMETLSDFARGTQTPTGTREIEQLRKARKILEDEFVNPPGLFALARRVGLNDFKLKRGFRENFGTTVFGYVRSLRLDKARSLLEIGDLNVTEAALEAGYSSLGHFAAAFKKRFGTLPSAYLAGRRTFAVPRK